MLTTLLLTVLSADPCPVELFRIERSKNANVVVYEAKRGSLAGLDAKEPVTASWVLLASKGEREPLGYFERSMAYGFDVHRAAGTGFSLTLNALKQRVIRLGLQAGCPSALSSIGGHEGVLKKIYVKADDRKLVPAVEYVELYGIDGTGAALYEKIFPDAR